MVAVDHYMTLGVSPDAERDAIRSAYRGLMRRYHPDVNRSRGAAARAKAINEAYACLRDPSKRALYDRERDRDRGADRAPPPRRGSPFTMPPPPDIASAAADVGGWRRPRWGRPTWWQAFGLVGASIVTVITFSATSATPPFNAPADGPAVTNMRSVERTPPQPTGHRDGGRTRSTRD